MNRLILCEGKTDAILLSYYLGKTCGWEFCKNAPKGAKIVADATGKLLVNVLKHKPFLIKPNKHELEEIFEKEIKTHEEIVIYAKKLQ